MSAWVRLIGGGVALTAAVGYLVHTRSVVLAEHYALGEAVVFEAEAGVTGRRLREGWERANEPLRLRARAEAELGMQVPSSRQVVR